uniref:CSON000429 protein n=1 Tax=Culicoides sonorensis TaxID=179676 RepID=A0A336KW68_CULSO
MDRARGRFNQGGYDSPRDRGDGRGSGGSGNNSPYAGPSSSGNGNDYKRKRESSVASDSSTLSELKRQRSGPKHGKIERRLRVDLDYTRPEGVVKTGYGSKDAAVQQVVHLTANYFHLTNKPNFIVYLYHVDMEPDIDVTIIKKAVFRDNTTHITFGKIYDGTNLYTTRKFDNDPYEIEGTRKDGEKVKITIKFVKEVSSFQDLGIYQLLNSIKRRAIEGLKLQLVGRNFYDAVAKIPIPNLRLEIWPGYVTSIRQHDANLLMCCELDSKVMRMETLYEIYRGCVKNHRDYKVAFYKEVIGRTVLTDYNNKTYRIDDVDYEQTPESTFETKAGPVSFKDYYLKRYNIRLRSLDQPLLMSRSKEKRKRGGEAEIIALIPELCRATGITEEMRSNFQSMRNLSEIMRLNPMKRVDRLRTFSRRLNDTPECRQALNQLEMKLDSDLISIEGRLIPKPEILFGRQGAKVSKEFSHDLRNLGLYKPGVLNNWVAISTERDARATEDFCRALKQSVERSGLQIYNPRFVHLRGDHKDELIRKIDDVVNQDPQIILFVVPNNQADRYQAIKKKLCIEKSVPSQVVVARTIQPKGGRGPNLSVATKVAVQMSCKIGGAPWGIKVPLTGMLIIGFDVSHDTKNKKITFGALVASLDQNQSKFFSCVSQHQDDAQLSTDFTLNVMKAIKEFQKVNGSNPTKLLIYRDGVGEGQIAHVRTYEKEPLEKMLKSQFGEDFRFAFVIVNKKTNTRLFSMDRGNPQNPPPGTVCDTKITLPERYDFFLIPTDCRQGTVSPTYFNVIADTLGLPAAKMQMLTYYLCHGYFNWTDAITVPAVIKLAGKLAFLCSQHLHQAPAIWQQQRLYFL